MNPSRYLTAFALMLSGCAGEPQTYPSLAKRPVESAPIAQPAPPPLPVEADAALNAELAKYVAQADKGRTAFDAAYAKAQKAVGAASGAAVSSDSWVAAQVAISSLEAARNDSVSALASLDTLYVQRTNALADGKARGGLTEIETARSATLTSVDQQNDRIDAMKAKLRQP
ncbi:hypothetical protein [Sphingobium sp.]|uniref:hypothetical protein n=1 Tax=Sphingobium sp. TaxID=1912891 RepID=UPI003BB67403